ncbi:chaperonin 10-like protein, partial [Coemansia spiralis]
QVEVQVHAAAVNKIDYGRAAGALVAVYPNELPMKIGYDVAGIVTSVGTHATKFKVGDRVYGCVNHDEIGTIAEYVLSEEAHLAELPSNIEFTAGASVPLAGLTAKQAMDAGHAEGKETIFVSGGMGGVGMFGVALARHHFKAQNVLTTVSTSKVEYAKKMGATQVVDYTKEDHTKVLESAADMVFDSIGDTESYKVAKPNTVVASVVPISDKSKMDKVLSDFKTKNVRYVLN